MNKSRSRSRCAICHEPFGWIYQVAGSNYEYLVCQECDAKAITADGEEPKHGNEYVGRETVIEKTEDTIRIREAPARGDNPVYVEGMKCWQNYKFGGWETFYDPFDCDSINEFFDRISE